MDRATTDEMVEKTRITQARAAEKAQVRAKVSAEWTRGDDVFDRKYTSLVRQGAETCGISCMHLRSIVGPDPYCISRIVPMAFVFSPCIGGVTHNEAKDIPFQPRVKAVTVLLDACLARANQQGSPI